MTDARSSAEGKAFSGQSGPEPDVLSEALAAARVMGLAGPRASWLIEERFERDRSIIFVLRTTSPGEKPVCAYYKAIVAPHPENDRLREAWSNEIQAGLARSMELSERFRELARAYGVFPARILCVDPERLLVVTLAIRGRPLAKAIWYSLSRRQRSQARHIYQTLGRAIRVIEESSPPHVDADREAIWRVLGFHLPKAEQILSRQDALVLRERLEALYEEALAQPQGVSYAHGDLSRANILVDGGAIGLLDFLWVPRLRGHDLSKFCFRLEHDQPAPRSWTRHLVQELLAGYGRPDLVEDPGWQFLRLQWLLSLAVRHAAAPRVSRQRAIAELKQILKSGREF